LPYTTLFRSLHAPPAYGDRRGDGEAGGDGGLARAAGSNGAGVHVRDPGGVGQAGDESQGRARGGARVRERGLRGGGYDGQGRCDHRRRDRKSTRLNSSHVSISYAVFCLKKKNKITILQNKYSRLI